MDESPYAPPKADLGEPAKIEVPDDIARKIRNGWIAALVSAAFTAGLVALALSTGAMENLFDIWSTADIVLILVLAFGIYKKSRVAATAMLVYFLASKILIMVETGKPSGLLLSLVFLYFYFQAMVGTYQYHKLLKTA